jgi:hypothetical protein
MFGCRRCCGVFLLVGERCASRSPKSRRVRRAINWALRSLSEFSDSGLGERAQGQGLTAERREPVGAMVGQADPGLTQRATLPPAIAEQWADQRQPASSSGQVPDEP